MIKLIHGRSAPSESDALLLKQMFRLRAQMFRERRGWRVDTFEGLEIDAFDELDPLYVISVDDAGRLQASLRLLPTTGPHMLTVVFPELIDGLDAVRHPLVWESSRFCVDTTVARDRSARGLHLATGEILTALFEVAWRAGLDYVVTVYDLAIDRIVRRAGCRFEPLGQIVEIDGLPTMAALSEVNADVVAAIRDRAGIRSDLIAPDYFQLARVA